MLHNTSTVRIQWSSWVSPFSSISILLTVLRFPFPSGGSPFDSSPQDERPDLWRHVVLICLIRINKSANCVKVTSQSANAPNWCFQSNRPISELHVRLSSPSFIQLLRNEERRCENVYVHVRLSRGRLTPPMNTSHVCETLMREEWCWTGAAAARLIHTEVYKILQMKRNTKNPDL